VVKLLITKEIEVGLGGSNIKHYHALGYDGWYWHNPKDDRRKDEYLKSKGWKVLRIRSGHKIPTIEQLEIAIKKLTTTDKVFTTITLDDWKEEEYEFSLSRSDRK